MSEERTPEPGQPALTPSDQTLLPSSTSEGMAPPPAWMPIPPPPPTSVWSRIAAYIVLIAVVAAVWGGGIGWSIAPALHNQPGAPAAAPPPAPPQQATPGANTTPRGTPAPSAG